MIVTVFITICQNSRNQQPQQRMTRNFNWNSPGNKTLQELGSHPSDEKIGIAIDFFHISTDETTNTGLMEGRIEYAGTQYNQLLVLAQSKGFVNA